MSQPHRLEEEDKVLSTAVKSVLHSLMAMAGDEDLDSDTRIWAATVVLGYAADSSPSEDLEEDLAENTDESEGDGNGSERE